jgi:hypothetical protein
VFFFLVFLIFKIMSPSSAPSTEFAQNSAATTTTTTQRTVTEPKKVVEHKVVVTTTRPAVVPQPSSVVTEAARAPAITISPSSTPTTVVQVPTQTLTQNGQRQPGAPVTVVVQQPTAASATSELTSAQSANAIDRLIALQDQNTKLVNQLQAESAQKIADYEAQNIAMQGKLQDMNMRMNSIEATLTRLGKLMQDIKGGSEGGASRAMDMSEGGANQQMMARPIAAVKAAYAVQAIIPGRAWLKAENGETVTVAEGDIIKNYGRITKIDPYDGIVQIDAGGRIVTLSYGAGAE